MEKTREMGKESELFVFFYSHIALWFAPPRGHRSRVAILRRQEGIEAAGWCLVVVWKGMRVVWVKAEVKVDGEQKNSQGLCLGQGR